MTVDLHVTLAEEDGWVQLVVRNDNSTTVVACEPPDRLAWAEGGEHRRQQIRDTAGRLAATLGVPLTTLNNRQP